MFTLMNSDKSYLLSPFSLLWKPVALMQHNVSVLKINLNLWDDNHRKNYFPKKDWIDKYWKSYMKKYPKIIYWKYIKLTEIIRKDPNHWQNKFGRQ